ncbi:hypothetical protein O181_054666 [Austropuccinia psidii MF-1]|uniref:CID domain-containing protein n=1 Tax=Austropuccinia psidii MF-1 TaxID=1389203 RepID=A0A9Q3E2Y8_9BASI|nr:hypothetical protein [Austropuccinia psidii MF-1]
MDGFEHRNKYGEDLWDYLVEEWQKASLNARINLLYLVDSLLLSSSTTLLSSSQTETSSSDFNYGAMIKRDLVKLIEATVPTNMKKKGLLNLVSTQYVLKNWRSQIGLIGRFISLEAIDALDQLLLDRKKILADTNGDAADLDDDVVGSSKREILDRIDDDRERHKRLREQIWVLPIPQLSSYHHKLLNPQHPASTYAFHRSATLLHLYLRNTPNADSFKQPAPHLDADAAISLECDQLIASNAEDTGYEGLEKSDWLAMKFENKRCYGSDTGGT